MKKKKKNQKKKNRKTSQQIQESYYSFNMKRFHPLSSMHQKISFTVIPQLLDKNLY